MVNEFITDLYADYFTEEALQYLPNINKMQIDQIQDSDEPTTLVGEFQKWFHLFINFKESEITKEQVLEIVYSYGVPQSDELERHVAALWRNTDLKPNINSKWINREFAIDLASLRRYKEGRSSVIFFNCLDNAEVLSKEFGSVLHDNYKRVAENTEHFRNAVTFIGWDVEKDQVDFSLVNGCIYDGTDVTYINDAKCFITGEIYAFDGGRYLLDYEDEEHYAIEQIKEHFSHIWDDKFATEDYSLYWCKSAEYRLVEIRDRTRADD